MIFQRFTRVYHIFFTVGQNITDKPSLEIDRIHQGKELQFTRAFKKKCSIS